MDVSIEDIFHGQSRFIKQHFSIFFVVAYLTNFSGEFLSVIFLIFRDKSIKECILSGIFLCSLNEPLLI
jgi:hypothetical protein